MEVEAEVKVDSATDSASSTSTSTEARDFFKNRDMIAVGWFGLVWFGLIGFVWFVCFGWFGRFGLVWFGLVGLVWFVCFGWFCRFGCFGCFGWFGLVRFGWLVDDFFYEKKLWMCWVLPRYWWIFLLINAVLFCFLFGLFRRLCRLLVFVFVFVFVSVFVYLLIFFLSDSFFYPCRLVEGMFKLTISPVVLEISTWPNFRGLGFFLVDNVNKANTLKSRVRDLE